MTDCEYCARGSEVCGDRSPEQGFVCTRPAGHDGEHVACADADRPAVDDHAIETWRDGGGE